jgi:predicted  nucleic acid-binding Zn-ribbon protein
VTNLPTILGDVFSLGINLGGGLVEGLFSALFGPDDYAEKYADELNDSIQDIQRSTSRAGAILEYMDSLYQKDGLAAQNTAAWATALSELEEVMPGAGDIIKQHGQDVNGALSELKKMNEELERTAMINAFLKTQQDLYADIAEHKVKIGSAQTQLDIINVEIAAKTSDLRANFDSALDRYSELLEKNADIQKEYGTFNQEKYDESKANIDTWREQFYGMDWSDSSARQNYTLLTNAVGYGISGLGGGAFDFTPIADIQKAFSDIAYLQAEAAPYRNTINENEKELADLEKELEDIKAGYAAYTQSITEQTSSYSAAASAATAAVQGLADNINSIEIPGTIGDGYAPKATGLEWVPYDGFRAELHRGERILTAAENAEYSRGGYRGGMDYDRVGSMIGSAINEAMGRIGVYLGAEKVADMTSRRTGKNIRVNSNARLKAMGG